MVSKKELLKNLQNFSAEEIAEAVRSGKVTLYELSKESGGLFTPLLKMQVQAILDKPQSKPTTLTDVEEPLNPVQEELMPAISGDELFQISEPLSDVTQTNNAGTESASRNSAEKQTNRDNKGMFRHPFSFKGRIRRTEYGISMLIYFIWNSIGQVLMASPDSSSGAAMFVLLSFIPMIWFLWAQNCKRCHDRGNSGWYQLIPFYFLVLLFGDGDPGSNNYGENPKQ